VTGRCAGTGGGVGETPDVDKEPAMAYRIVCDMCRGTGMLEYTTGGGGIPAAALLGRGGRWGGGKPPRNGWWWPCACLGARLSTSSALPVVRVSDLLWPVSDSALKDSRKLRARFSSPLSRLLVMTVTSPRYLVLQGRQSGM
jgi:hypothetical protein